MEEDLWSEPEAPAIDAILEQGYELLDGYAAWLERKLGLPERSVQRDCFNAEAYIDYLANVVQKRVTEANEFDLRWFVFSYYIRKSLADQETADRLLVSLKSLHAYLAAHHSYAPAEWVDATLDDATYFLKRLRDYEALDQNDERQWQHGFTLWCEELDEDLDTRCLAMPRELAPGIAWSDVAQWREAGLRIEANAVWQAERARLLEQGYSFDRMPPLLLEAYERWTHTPQDKLDGMSPIEVIYEERERAGQEEFDDEEDDGDLQAGY